MLENPAQFAELERMPKTKIQQMILMDMTTVRRE